MEMVKVVISQVRKFFFDTRWLALQQPQATIVAQFGSTHSPTGHLGQSAKYLVLAAALASTSFEKIYYTAYSSHCTELHTTVVAHFGITYNPNGCLGQTAKFSDPAATPATTSFEIFYNTLEMIA